MPSPPTTTRAEPELEPDAPRVRAVALPPGERRAAIVAATVPLLVSHGTSVTTRQIADAAGVAEGTIFRVFADKDAVIDAAVEAALDPAPVEAALAAIDRQLPFEDQLVRAVDILRVRMTEIWQLLSGLGRTAPSKDRMRQVDLPELVALFEPLRARLRQQPEVAARLLRGLVLATSHPALVVGEPMAPAELVSALLDGVRRPDHPAAAVPASKPSN
jgi:AcrR family transcriptional regulator